VYTKLILLVLI